MCLLRSGKFSQCSFLHEGVSEGVFIAMTTLELTKQPWRSSSAVFEKVEFHGIAAILLRASISKDRVADGRIYLRHKSTPALRRRNKTKISMTDPHVLRDSDRQFLYGVGF